MDTPKLHHCGVWMSSSISVCHLFIIYRTQLQSFTARSTCTHKMCTALLLCTDFTFNLSFSVTHFWWREMTGKSKPRVSSYGWRHNWSGGNISSLNKIPYTLSQSFMWCPKARNGRSSSAQVWERFLMGRIVQFSMSHKTLSKYRY